MLYGLSGLCTVWIQCSVSGPYIVFSVSGDAVCVECCVSGLYTVWSECYVSGLHTVWSECPVIGLHAVLYDCSVGVLYAVRFEHFVSGHLVVFLSRQLKYGQCWYQTQ